MLKICLMIFIMVSFWETLFICNDKRNSLKLEFSTILVCTAWMQTSTMYPVWTAYSIHVQGLHKAPLSCLPQPNTFSKKKKKTPCRIKNKQLRINIEFMTVLELQHAMTKKAERLEADTNFSTSLFWPCWHSGNDCSPHQYKWEEHQWELGLKNKLTLTLLNHYKHRREDVLNLSNLTCHTK